MHLRQPSIHLIHIITLKLILLLPSLECIHLYTTQLHCTVPYHPHLGYIDGIESSGKIFIAVYMLFFSSLLFAFEFIRIRPVDWIDHMLLRNFGFLYGALGKSLFIIL
jgi:hypothetical protein